MQPINMPSTIKPVAPFYNDDCAPPPFPPMLTDQLEPFGSSHLSAGLLANKIIDPSNTKSSLKITPEFHHPMTRLVSPYPKKTARTNLNHGTSHPQGSNSDLEDSEESTSDGESTSTILSQEYKILKPQGELDTLAEADTLWRQRSTGTTSRFPHSRCVPPLLF